MYTIVPYCNSIFNRHIIIMQKNSHKEHRDIISEALPGIQTSIAIYYNK